MVALLTSCLLLAAQGASAWTTVGPGVEYQEWQLPDPNNVFVARMDRHNPACTIESTISLGRLSGGFETVRNQAGRYDDAISYWGRDWGRRNDVIVAINGDFYNTSTGVPTSGQVQSGWFSKPYGGAAFGWTLDRGAFISSSYTLMPRVFYLTTGASQDCQGINRSRDVSELVCYTPQYDSDTNTDNTGVEVLVEMARPDLVTPTSEPVRGWVRQIRNNQGSTPIPFDHLVLSATGTAATKLLNNVSLGAEIGISSQTSTPAPWTHTYASVGAGEVFLYNGTVTGGQAVLHPRTAIAFNDDYIFFVVVDGRSSVSIGMTMTDIGNFCKDYLGAKWGINQDGGGSSTMVVNGVVKNDPSDGTERAVANGMMIVAVQPKSQSTTFGVNDLIRATAANSNVRLGPGTNYSVLTTVAKNTEGRILNHSLRGIAAKSYSWWKCDFAGTMGWVAETNLAFAALGGYPTFSQHPSERNPCLGDTAGFSVSAGGTGSLTYQWQKDGVNLGDGGRYAGTSIAALSISNVGQTDTGSYRCVVSDSVGIATSYSAALLTPRTPTTILQQPQSLDAPPVLHGTNATFTTAAFGDGVVTYRWQYNGNNLAEDARHVGVTSATLTILHVVAVYDDGAYRCRVTAGCGNVYTDLAQLKVIKPDFDGDGDVDNQDFGHLQACFSGKAAAAQDPACKDARMDSDSDCDENDASRFLNCLSGSGQPYNIHCLDY